MQHFALERLIMAINGHARAEYANWIYYRVYVAASFWETIDKFKHWDTIVEHATEVEHCKVFNYAAVARLDKRWICS
jgi:hypothetical protein